MIKYIKVTLIVAFLIFGLTACKAKSQDGMDDVYSVQDTASTGELTPGTWGTDYKQALETAKKTGKSILIDFTGSDWCGWCMKLDKEVFSQQAFIDYSKGNLVLLKLDFPKKIAQTEAVKKQNNDLAQKFNIEGFPTIILLDKDGNYVDKTGYQQGGAESYVEHLKSLLKK